MPWRGPDVPGEYPTLGYQVADWIEAHCVIPDGDFAGQPYLLTDEMLRFLLQHYRLDPDTVFNRQRGAWRLPFVHFRGSQLTRPQKWGKGPFISSIVCAECAPDGPVIFDGWDASGEPVGRPVPTPWWQITAVSESQTDNTWRALQPMIELGALKADIPDTGLTRINLPSGGWIEPVTSSASSRLGQRIKGAVEDETHDWRRLNGGVKLADTQRRNLAGMNGRFLSTTNAWDPAENSVAQSTAEDDEPGVYHDDVEPGAGSVRNKQDRRRMIKRVYGDSWWVDPDRIDAEIVALLKRDAAQAERFFLNRKRASEGAAFDHDQLDRIEDKTVTVEPRELITLGVDGARFVDALGIVATDVKAGYQWPVGIWERPKDAAPSYEHPPDLIDGAITEAFEVYDVWRVYVDPQYIEDYFYRWQGRWGRERIVEWRTNRPSQAVWAVREYTVAVGGVQPDGQTLDGDLTHSGDEDFVRHLKNARKRKERVRDEKGVEMHTLAKETSDSPLKMDAAWAGCLSWKARSDAVAAGAKKAQRRKSIVFV